MYFPRDAKYVPTTFFFLSSHRPAKIYVKSNLRKLPYVSQGVNILILQSMGHAAGGAVGWATALHPEGRRFNSLWYHSNFSLTQSFRPHYGPGVDSASNRNEYREYFLGVKGGRWVGLTALQPSCADCLEIWEPKTPGNFSAWLSSHVMVCLYLIFTLS